MIQALIITALLAGGPYVSVKTGLAILENHELHFEEHTYKTGVGLTGALGYDFGLLRSELEVVQTWNKQDMTYNLDWTPKGTGGFDVTKRFYFINGIIDIPVYGDFEVYAGAGYGFPRYQLLGGLKYNLSEKWALDLGYRFIHDPYDPREYTGAQCNHFPGGICSGPEPVYENHLITVGLSYYFGERDDN